MASHLAAQDYLARLQASGLSFPGMAGGPDGVLPPSFPILSQQHTGRRSMEIFLIFFFTFNVKYLHPLPVNDS